MFWYQTYQSIPFVFIYNFFLGPFPDFFFSLKKWNGGAGLVAYSVKFADSASAA